VGWFYKAHAAHRTKGASSSKPAGQPTCSSQGTYTLFINGLRKVGEAVFMENPLDKSADFFVSRRDFIIPRGKKGKRHHVSCISTRRGFTWDLFPISVPLYTAGDITQIPTLGYLSLPLSRKKRGKKRKKAERVIWNFSSDTTLVRRVHND